LKGRGALRQSGVLSSQLACQRKTATATARVMQSSMVRKRANRSALWRELFAKACSPSLRRSPRRRTARSATSAAPITREQNSAIHATRYSGHNAARSPPCHTARKLVLIGAAVRCKRSLRTGSDGSAGKVHTELGRDDCEERRAGQGAVDCQTQRHDRQYQRKRVVWSCCHLRHRWHTHFFHPPFSCLFLIRISSPVCFSGLRSKTDPTRYADTCTKYLGRFLNGLSCSSGCL